MLSVMIQRLTWIWIFDCSSMSWLNPMKQPFYIDGYCGGEEKHLRSRFSIYHEVDIVEQPGKSSRPVGVLQGHKRGGFPIDCEISFVAVQPNLRNLE